MINKRDFVASVGLAGVMLPAANAIAAPGNKAGNAQPVLLTVSGAVGKTNRGALDPVIDQMMGKHSIQFSKAFAFDAAALQRLPAVTIKPTLEYDGKPHTLEGPLLVTVLEAAGVPRGSNVQLGLRAVDGYNVAISLADAAQYRMIVATRIDGQPMALGGLGPQWAVYDADNVAPFKDKPVKERFALCPWGMYHIDVKAAA
ncbi:molybdopterin-dependent oxidoreductase [Acidovorax sp.]|uniref:molybdopterin-dependent oxidoreductase n=2 Tax=unclassified Acidovorax TaxID=2684926 RepID=UPI003D01A5CC